MRLYIFEDGMMLQSQGPVSSEDHSSVEEGYLNIIEVSIPVNGEFYFYCNGEKVPDAKNPDI